MQPSFILIHGAWHGGWAWDPVAERLRSGGFAVVAPTLVGLGERAAEVTPGTCLSDHVGQVVGEIDAVAGPVVLVGHSYGGMVIAGAASRRPERVVRLVYLDALVPADGESVATFAGPDFVGAGRADADARGDGCVGTGFFPPTKFVDWEGERLERFAARLTPQPLQAFLEPVRLEGDISRIPADFVLATDEPLGLFEPFAEEARGRLGWRVFELPTRHDAMLTMPGVVAAMLAEPWISGG